MAKLTIEDTTLTNIADAIRAKGNTTDSLTPVQMPAAINAIVAGGGSLDAGQVFKRYFGEDTDSPMAQSLKQAIDAYQYQARAKNYNDNEALYKETCGTKEKFENDIATRASKHG